MGDTCTISCVEATNFFSLVQKLFTFFSASTSRWGILVQYLEGGKRVLKCWSDMRWSARAEATKALSERYDTIFELLFYILCKILNSEQIYPTRSYNGLHISLSYLDTVFMAACILIVTSLWKGSTELAWLFKVLKLSYRNSCQTATVTPGLRVRT